MWKMVENVGMGVQFKSEEYSWSSAIFKCKIWAFAGGFTFRAPGYSDFYLEYVHFLRISSGIIKYQH